MSLPKVTTEEYELFKDFLKLTGFKIEECEPRDFLEVWEEFKSLEDRSNGKSE